MASIKHDKTARQIADIFDVNEQTPAVWKRAGCPCRRDKKTKRLLFNEGEISAWLAENPERGQRGRPPETDLSVLEARRRKEWALAHRYEIELAAIRGTLILKADAARHESKICYAFKAFFDAIGSRAYELAGQPEPKIAEIVEGWRDEFYSAIAYGPDADTKPDDAAPIAAINAPSTTAPGLENQ